MPKPNQFLLFVGTVCYTGLIPLAPGTIASLIAIPFVWLLKRNQLIYVLITILTIIIGVISAKHLSIIWHKKDDSRITIDEFVGILVTFLLLPKINWLILLIGFILFRFFDIFKPLFIRKSEKVSDGIGVMFDDILAGIYTNLLLRIFVLILY